MTTAVGPSAGWYSDPAGVYESRYWDGTSWTEHVSDRGVTSTAPTQAAFAAPAPTPVAPPPSFGSPRDARAQAKAAKAYAKAQRPFYRKKRWWVLGAIVVIIIAAIASSSGKTTKPAAAKSTGGVQSASDNAKHPPQADVSISGCSYDASTQFATATLSILNHSSQRSNYLIEVSFENSKGVQLGSNAAGGGDNVDAGQKSLVQAVDSLTAPPDALKCVLKSVNRFAS